MKHRKVVSLKDAIEVLEHFGVDHSNFNIDEYFKKSQKLVNDNKDYTVKTDVLNIVEVDQVKKYKCIKGTFFDLCDGDGFTIENEYFDLEEGSIWERADYEFRVLGGDIRLDSMDGDRWLEVSEETLQDHFVEVE